VLALQRNAGNQAVGAILARFQEEEHGAKRRSTLQLDGIGSVDVESVKPRGVGGYELTIRGHSLTAALTAAARNASIIEHARILIGNMRIELRQVLIADLELNGELISLQLDAQSAETKWGPSEDDELDQDGPRKQWDPADPPFSG
jgi:hypothetical protein